MLQRLSRRPRVARLTADIDLLDHAWSRSSTADPALAIVSGCSPPCRGSVAVLACTLIALLPELGR